MFFAIFFRNNEVQFAGELQPRGCCYTLKVPAGDQEVDSVKPSSGIDFIRILFLSFTAVCSHFSAHLCYTFFFSNLLTVV